VKSFYDDVLMQNVIVALLNPFCLFKIFFHGGSFVEGVELSAEHSR